MFRSYLSSFVGLMMVVVACTDDVTEPQESDVSCSIPATVKDLTGLDGCGFVFELEDGVLLEPIRPVFFCGTPPLPKEITEDPLYNFEFIDGKQVLINYEVTKSASVCMVGDVVKITCIKEVSAAAPQSDQ